MDFPIRTHIKKVFLFFYLLKNIVPAIKKRISVIELLVRLAHMINDRMCLFRRPWSDGSHNFMVFSRW